MKKILEFLVVIVIMIIVIMLIGFPVMWIWNWLMPTIFGLIKITFWQAVGLTVLGNMLFNLQTSK